MKLSLRELFLSEDALAPESDPLVRLGALHHLHRTLDRDKLPSRLVELLRAYDVSALQKSDPESSVFPLHVAIALAQEGGAEGISWLLRFLVEGDLNLQRLGFTALRNCRQFPFAVLLGSALSAQGLESSRTRLGSLVTFSDDQAWDLVRQGDVAQRSEMVSHIEESIGQVSTYVRADRRLARGSIITQPFWNDKGSRFTGFLIVEEASGTLRGVPYRMPSLINRDDGAASESARDLSQKGREVFVVYDADGDQEAQVMYAIPFARNGDVRNLIARAAISCSGFDIGVVIDKWDAGKGPRYRLITATGNTGIGRYDADRQELGSCWIFHSSSTLPVSCRMSLTKEETEEVISRFVEKTALERAVLLRTWDKGFILGGQTGRIEGFRGPAPTDLVILLEDALIKETEHTFPVSLPFAHWAAQDRSSVLQEFFNNSRASYAVVVNLSPAGRNNRQAITVHPESGRYQFRKATPEIKPGTPVFWEDGDDDRVYLNFLTDEIVDADCEACFDSGYRLCVDCDGTGQMVCSQCGGSGKSSCGHCDGTGRRRIGDCKGCRGTGKCGNCGGSTILSCKVCHGLGSYSDSGRVCVKCKGVPNYTCRVCTVGPQPRGRCPNCKGSGDFRQPCRTCNETGRWNCNQCGTTGIARCESCRGSLVSSCPCGGNTDIRIVPVIERGS